MLKIIETGSFDFGEPAVKIISDFEGTGLTKQAADSRISEFISKIQPDEGKIYLHILAMGAGEYYGANRNADYFPENNLIDFYKTFETSPAHVFRNHVNKDPTIAIGQVIYSIYNERMHRVELIAWVDKVKGADIVERIEKGDFPATSMACKTPYDVCAVCGNKAASRQQYCEHLTDQLGRIYPDGKKAMALNLAPLKFFDISIVVRPADITSSVLQKVASTRSEVKGSAELAEIIGLVEKKAAHKKLSEFIKEIEGGVVLDASESLDTILSKVRDPHTETIHALSEFELSDIIATMAHLGISPSIEFLADVIGRKIHGPEAIGIGAIVEDYIGEHGVDSLPMSDKGPKSASPNPFIADILMPSVKQASLLPEFVAGRAFDSEYGTAIPGTGVGFFGNGPKVEETPMERMKRLYPSLNKEEGGFPFKELIKNVILIGGAALLAKWYITNAINEKMQQIHSSQPNGVKIVLVKSANDYRSTYRLANASMVRAVKRI